MVDNTIKPATKEEKFECLKAQLVKKGRWNAEAEQHLKDTLGLNQPENAETPVVEQPVVEAKPIVSRGRIGKKDSTSKKPVKKETVKEVKAKDKKEETKVEVQPAGESTEDQGKEPANTEVK